VLGAVAGQTAVGSYGAADTLVEKLLIIPDGVCTALFPTLASVFSRSREEAGALYRKIFRYFLLLALPIAVGTTVLAHPIIDLMYGAEYRRSAWVLVVLVWGLFVSFFAQLHGWSVGAIGQERRGFMVPIYATGVYLAVGGLLIPELGELGLAIAGVVLSAVSFALNGRILRAHLSDRAIPGGEAARVILASAVMGAVTFAVRAAPVFVSIPVGVAAYGLAAVGTKAVRPAELSELLGMVRGRFRARPAAES
jgi:O-antigen/teichoic acid export membrane protein